MRFFIIGKYFLAEYYYHTHDMSQGSHDEEMYKYKYLKYKSKYMNLKNSSRGGDWESIKSKMSKMTSSLASKLLPTAVILTKLETLQYLEPKLGKIGVETVEMDIHCMAIQNILIGKAHIFTKSDTKFMPFTMAHPLCGESISQKKFSEISGKIAEKAKPIVATVGSELKKTAQQMDAKVTETATKKVGESVGRVKSSFFSFLDTFSKPQKGGASVDIVRDAIRAAWESGVSAQGIEDVLSEFKYDVVIRYQPQVSLDPRTSKPSKIYVTRLTPPELPQPAPQPAPSVSSEPLSPQKPSVQTKPLPPTPK